jgi:hypothetical protein
LGRIAAKLAGDVDSSRRSRGAFCRMFRHVWTQIGDLDPFVLRQEHGLI